MHSISDIALINDLLNLPKETLKEICTDLNLDDNGYKSDLATRIFSFLEKNPENNTLESCNQKLLAGQTSITWFRLENGISVGEFQHLICSSLEFNPFERMIVPDIQELSTEPTLICGAEGLNGNDVFLRYIYKSGIRQEPFVRGITTTPRSALSTVYFNPDSGILELRGDPRKSEKIAKNVARLLKQQISLEQVEAPFSQQIGQIADSINGELIDATSKPELILEDFNDEQAEAVKNVLLALDEYFNSNDTEQLEEQLQQANAAFHDYEISVPISALILSGMNKISLGGQREIRGLPLYEYLNPNLQHQGGFIRFNFNEDGLEKSHTIRVGMLSKSIYFTTPATENVIDFVRKNVILGS